MLAFVGDHFPNGFTRSANSKITPRVRFEAIAVGTHLALQQNRDLQAPDMRWLESAAFSKLVRTDASNSGPKLRARVEFVRDALLLAE